MDKLFTKGKATAGHTNVFVTPELGFFLKCMIFTLHSFCCPLKPEYSWMILNYLYIYLNVLAASMQKTQNINGGWWAGGKGQRACEQGQVWKPRGVLATTPARGSKLQQGWTMFCAIWRVISCSAPLGLSGLTLGHPSNLFEPQFPQL